MLYHEYLYHIFKSITREMAVISKMLPKRITILVVLIAMIFSFTVACSTPASTTENGTTYKLVHNLPDLEYVFPWDTIASRIPDMNDPTKYD